MDVELRYIPKFDPLLTTDKKIVVFEGSARSGKTFTILQYLISRAIEAPEQITISRETLTWLKSTTWVDFQYIMTEQLKIWRPSSLNKTDMIYKLRGSEISFIGLDNPEKVHGRKQSMFFINEAIDCNYKEFEQLAIRTEGRNPCIFLDYNPKSTDSWIYDKVIPRDDCLFIHSTYLDNPFLPDSLKQEIERLEQIDSVSWQVYGLGKRADFKGLIFTNYFLCDTMPDQRQWTAYGLDFGFTNDPTALIEVTLHDGKLWLNERLYQTGMTNQDICRYLASINCNGTEIIADSAEPKSCEEIHRAGYNVHEAVKGPGSVNLGIDLMKQYPLMVTKSSINLIKELRNYRWKEDRTGKQLNEPIDLYNHAIDAIRYIVGYKIVNKPKPFYASAL